MIKLKLAAIALNVSIDQETNNISIFNVLEQVNAVALPGVMQEIVLISMFEKDTNDPEESLVSVKAISPSQKIVGIGNNLKMNFQDKKRNRLLIRLNNFQFHEYGKHSFEISWPDGKHTIDLEVSQSASKSH